MITQKLISWTNKNKRQLIIGLFITLHLFLLNYNVAEWGDSYRILRAGEFLKQGAYPSDEKRPPLLSLLLVPNPGIDSVLFGRFIVFLLSIGSFLVFEKICGHFLESDKKRYTALLLYALNPVLLYWSIRIMSDVLFVFLVLVVFWQYLEYAKHKKLGNLLLSGFFAGLSVLTRFEGYILVGSLGLGMFLHKPKDILKPAMFGFIALLIAGPYLIFRNPLTSSYFEEPASRKYDLEMVWIFLMSLLFSLGSVYLPYFTLSAKKKIFSVLRSNFPLTIFLALELMLVLVWPAAVPRLFLPILPFLIIFTAEGVDLTDIKLQKLKSIAFLLLLLSVYIFSQYFLKLQFLVSSRMQFLVIVVVQIVALIALLSKNKYFYASLFTSCVLWSYFVIHAHRDIFISVKSAGEYVAENLKGRVAYNDVSSVSDWYINYVGKETEGFYYNTEKKSNLTQDVLSEIGADYLIITNEHNTTMTLDLDKRPYLELLRDFRYNVNGKEFFAKVIKLRKN